MRKKWAIEQLGGTPENARLCTGVGSDASVRAWPDPLNNLIRDRVLAAIVRRHVARVMGLTVSEFHESKQAQEALEEALVDSPECLQQIGQRAAKYFKSSLAPAG